eukprot:TRINITY_DN3471_c0_g1_i1.p1 TRINITY_DN3471_c0_g1~~TRINITY_DN3471_c0_g1_i1.p1  ORF type:complete len:324 (+),score=100.00 TRINITY_DN3471_c0_g1_i1:231-1202(+)
MEFEFERKSGKIEIKLVCGKNDLFFRGKSGDLEWKLLINKDNYKDQLSGDEIMFNWEKYKQISIKIFKNEIQSSLSIHDLEKELTIKCEDKNYTDIFGEIKIRIPAVPKINSEVLLEKLVLAKKGGITERLDQVEELIENMILVLKNETMERKELTKEIREIKEILLKQNKEIEETKEKKTEITFGNGQKSVTINQTYVANKGTLLSQGKHAWKVRCDKVIPSYDLGVVSTSHVSHFNMDTQTAWGIRENGYVYWSSQKAIQNETNHQKFAFKDGEIILFELDCEKKTLKIDVKGNIFVHEDVILPVHVAFSGAQGSIATIID